MRTIKYGFILSFSLFGCGGADTQDVVGSGYNQTCTPNQQSECFCSNDKKGIQICSEDGSRFEECVCSSSDSSSSSSSSSGSGGKGNGGSGDSAGGSGNGGSGDGGAGGACVPKTECAPIANCGTIPDGCGGEVICPLCKGYEVCGSAPPNEFGMPQSGDTGECGFSCGPVPSYGGLPACNAGPNGETMEKWLCGIEGSLPPIPGCVVGTGEQAPTDYWCCPV